MRQNFNLNKRKREEAKKKKRDEKIARRLGLKTGALAPELPLPDTEIIPDIQPEETV